jgi:predicted MPP superfamily phosphohydrolase
LFPSLAEAGHRVHVLRLMTSAESAESLRTRCNEISKMITAMHGDLKALDHPPTHAEVIKALFELTKQVEVVKKHLIRLQKGDGSTLV